MRNRLEDGRLSDHHLGSWGYHTTMALLSDRGVITPPWRQRVYKIGKRVMRTNHMSYPGRWTFTLLGFMGDSLSCIHATVALRRCPRGHRFEKSTSPARQQTKVRVSPDNTSWLFLLPLRPAQSSVLDAHRRHGTHRGWPALLHGTPDLLRTIHRTAPI